MISHTQSDVGRLGHGIRINYMIWYEGCASASTYQTMVNQLTTNLKVVVLQLKEIKGDNSLYTWQNVKADYTNNGIVFLDNDITLDSGNNQGNRKRRNIVTGKKGLPCNKHKRLHTIQVVEDPSTMSSHLSHNITQ